MEPGKGDRKGNHDDVAEVDGEVIDSAGEPLGNREKPVNLLDVVPAALAVPRVVVGLDDGVAGQPNGDEDTKDEPMAKVGGEMALVIDLRDGGQEHDGTGVLLLLQWREVLGRGGIEREGLRDSKVVESFVESRGEPKAQWKGCVVDVHCPGQSGEGTSGIIDLGRLGKEGREETRVGVAERGARPEVSKVVDIVVGEWGFKLE